MEEEVQYEIKTKEKEVSTKINAQTSVYYQLNKQQIEELFRQEATLLNQDHHVQETHRRKNELESYLYTFKEHFRGKLSEYVEAAQKLELLNQFEALTNWLYGEGQAAQKSIYVEKLDLIKKHCDPIHQRYFAE